MDNEHKESCRKIIIINIRALKVLCGPDPMHSPKVIPIPPNTSAIPRENPPLQNVQKSYQKGRENGVSEQAGVEDEVEVVVERVNQKEHA